MPESVSLVPGQLLVALGVVVCVSSLSLVCVAADAAGRRHPRRDQKVGVVTCS